MKITLLIIAFIFVGACTSSGKKANSKLYYRFPENNLAPIKHLNIEVKRPSAMGILGNRPMVAQNSDGALLQMSHNFWLDSPTVLLNNYLAPVFSSNSNGNQLTLNSQILALEKKQQQALLSIHFTLINAEFKEILAKTYSLNRTLAEHSISEFSKAIASMLNEITQNLVNDLK